MPYPESKCKGCGAPVVWLKTKAGKNMLVDAETYHGEPMYDREKHRCHWGTCPVAEQFHKPKVDGSKVPLTPSEQRARGLNEKKGK